MSHNKIVQGCGIHHIALRASDLDRSIDFYTKALGFHVMARWGEDAQQIAMLDTGDGTVLEIFHGGRISGKVDETQAGAMFHLAFTVDDVDQAFTCAIQNGAVEKIAPRNVQLPAVPQPLSLRNAFVFGPDGEILEFIHFS